MDGFIKQSIAHTFQIGPFIDDTDGKTAETGLTIAYTDIFLSKHGAAAAAKNDTTNLTGTGDARGYYDCVLNATDTGTIGCLKVMAHIAGALPVWHTFVVLPALVYDSIVAGSDALQVHVNEITNDIITAAAIANGALDANTFASGALDAVWGVAARALTDKAGFALADTTSDAVIADAVWNALTATYGVANSYGILLETQLDAAISSRSSHVAGDIWAVGTRALTDKVGFGISSQAVTDVWAKAGTITSLAMMLLVERIYEMINNKMTVLEANGNVSLKASDGSTDIATGNVASSSGTTTRAVLSWV